MSTFPVISNKAITLQAYENNLVYPGNPQPSGDTWLTDFTLVDGTTQIDLALIPTLQALLAAATFYAPDLIISIGGVTYSDFQGYAGGGGSGGGALVSVSDSPSAGPLTDYAPAGYVGGRTNRMLITAASGGTTINSLSAVGVPDGYEVLIVNPSATDPLIFPNAAAGATPFANVNAGTIQVGPGASAAIALVVNKWKFS